MAAEPIYGGDRFTEPMYASHSELARAHAKRAAEVVKSIRVGIYPTGVIVTGQVAQIHATLAVAHATLASVYPDEV